MGRVHFFSLFLLSLAVSVTMPFAAEAKTRVVTLADHIVVYSGPGLFFRPLTVLSAKKEIPASAKIVTARANHFYRVRVSLDEKTSAIGFIPVTAKVRLVTDELNEDELEKFGEVALAQRAVQVAFANFRDQEKMWTLGYMNYLSPGFYAKAYGGQFFAPAGRALVAGGEIGNDALLIGPVSGAVSYAAGVFAPSQAGEIFEASDRLNALMQASFGLRYNLAGVMSASASAVQAVFFNANNSHPVSGLNLTLEIGL